MKIKTTYRDEHFIFVAFLFLEIVSRNGKMYIVNSVITVSRTYNNTSDLIQQDFRASIYSGKITKDKLNPIIDSDKVYVVDSSFQENVMSCRGRKHWNLWHQIISKLSSMRYIHRSEGEKNNKFTFKNVT